MRYQVKIRGTSPIIMHNGAAGLDTRSAANLEKAELTRKKGSNRTEADEARIRQLEVATSLWLDSEQRPTVPEAALRAVIEGAARKLKQGPQVREGLIVESTDLFEYDEDRYGRSHEELIGRAAESGLEFTTGVVVQRSRLLRTRAKFDDWAVTFTLEGDDALVDSTQLDAWLDIGGRRLGLGDWRPEKSGHYGRFTAETITQL